MGSLFDKLAAAEDQFLGSEFLSPVLRNMPVRVRIAGVVMSLRIVRPKNFSGWGVFRPVSFKEAHKVRVPNLAERQEYLRLFPALQLIICRHEEGKFYGTLANLGETRFKIAGLVPVQLAEEVQMFDGVVVRFDGMTCWYEGPDPRHSARRSSYLRDSLAALLEPERLSLTGLTQAERDAYLMAYVPALEAATAAEEAAKKDRTEGKIKRALRHAGAQYRSHIERDTTFTVEYVVDGETHRSTVNKDTLGVESAGICLSGGDRTFDLQSLVGVLREGARTNQIRRVGDNATYDHYDEYD